ncbi:hypothetical protein GF362_00115 [Candidatus Dojkabacteria bacterium]|nr:hypothetical protein [Candidatus Dojkabacteria bacterium]
MSRTCDASGKTVIHGGTRKHRRGKAGGTKGPWAYKATRKNRTWKPNLRKVRVKVGGSDKTIKISMKYYKKLRKEGRIWLETEGEYAYL